MDFQIKIRGHRIEAGEIEAALVQHPAVKSAVVAAVGEQDSQDRLVAYVVPEATSSPSTKALKQFLSQKLPIHMLPSAFAFLEALPLSANGKVDRRVLRDREIRVQTLEADYVAPKSDLEKTVAAIFQDILGLKKVGIHDNFFDLGGNSLLLAKVYRKLLKILPEKTQPISLIDLFSYPTVKVLTQRLNPKSSVESSMPNKTDLTQKLTQGKNRLKQRFAKAKLIQ